jgi:hypothetical protein
VTLCFLSKAQTRVEMQSFSFSVRETIALWIFLKEILPASTRQTSILWRVDNTAALAHIRKEGGLKGRRLLREAERILILLDSRQLRILPAFIPSEENLQADPVGAGLASRSTSFSPDIIPVINLFASHQSAQTARFMFHVLAGCGLS